MPDRLLLVNGTDRLRLVNSTSFLLLASTAPEVERGAPYARSALVASPSAEVVLVPGPTGA